MKESCEHWCDFRLPGTERGRQGVKMATPPINGAGPVAGKAEGCWVGYYQLEMTTLVPILYGSNRVYIFFDDIMVLHSPIP